MARTYKAEGRKMGQGVAALLIIISFVVYYFFPGLHWGGLLGSWFVSYFIGEIFGSYWTNLLRENKKRSTKSRSNTSSTTKLSKEELLKADIETLSGKDFERLVAMYYEDKGYPVQLIGGAGDHGVDLIVQEPDGAKVAIQCKRQKSNVGNKVVLKLDSGRRVHGCHVGRVVTTSFFTPAAEEAAEKLRIELVNGMATINMLERWRLGRIKNTRNK